MLLLLIMGNKEIWLYGESCPVSKLLGSIVTSADCPLNLLRCGKEPRATWSSLQHVIAAVCCHSQTGGLTDVQDS